MMRGLAVTLAPFLLFSGGLRGDEECVAYVRGITGAPIASRVDGSFARLLAVERQPDGPCG